jgi:hypothetical protein
MKKHLVFLLIIALSGFFACQNADKQQTADSETNPDQIEQPEQDGQTGSEDLQQSDEPVKLENKQALNAKKVIPAESIQTGDEICGLTVKSIEFVSGGMFEIELEGEIDLQGHIYDNQHDYCMEFSIENPSTYVEIDGSEYVLLEYLILSNEESVKSGLSEDELNTYKEGLPVKYDVRVKNPTYNIYFSDKGRQRFGNATYVN